MKTMKTLAPVRALISMLAIVATVLPSAASASVSGLNGPCDVRDAALTGDNYPDKYGWAYDQTMLSAYVLSRFDMDASAWNRDFNGATCSSSNLSSFGMPNCGSRRIMNVLTVMQDVTVSGQTYSWKTWAEAQIDKLQPSSDCANTWGLNHPSWIGEISSDPVYRTISIMRVPLFYFSVLNRAALLVHEARHDDKPHNAYGQCTSTIDSCDSSWGYGGANAYQVRFYQDLLTSWNVSMTPVLRAEALEAANYFINGFFATHPGFNLKEQDSASPGYGDAEQVAWTWSSGGVQAAYFPNPAGPTDAITQVGLTMSGGSVVRLLVCWRTVNAGAAGTTLGAEDCADFGRPPVGLPDIQVAVPAGRVASRIKVATSGGKVSRICLYNRSLQGGVPMTDTTFTCSGSATSTYDVDLSPTAGHFLTGLGFGGSGGKITGWAMSQALAPDFEAFAGSYGGSASLLACPSGQVPVGLMANSVYAATWGANVVGYMGILCAEASWTGATSYGAVDYAKINVAHSSYYDTAANVWYPAGTHPLYDTSNGWALGNHPTNVKIKYCGLGARLRGMVVRSGAAVDAIDTLLCTNFQDVPFAVGGSGGFTKRQDCVFPPGVATWSSAKASAGIYARSGWYLDGLAMRCQM